MRGVRFVISSGSQRGEAFDFSSSPVQIGRRKGDLLLRDPKLSGSHAECRWNEEGAEVRDLNSLNGVFLNGRLIKRAILHHGDALLLGGTELLFYFLFSDEKRALEEEAASLAEQWMKLRFAPGTTERKIEELLVNELKNLKRGLE